MLQGHRVCPDCACAASPRACLPASRRFIVVTPPQWCCWPSCLMMPASYLWTHRVCWPCGLQHPCTTLHRAAASAAALAGTSHAHVGSCHEASGLASSGVCVRVGEGGRCWVAVQCCPKARQQQGWCVERSLQPVCLSSVESTVCKARCDLAPELLHPGQAYLWLL